jgi:hypothetical protein
MFPKYTLTNKQIKGIANIVLHEQGTVAGWYAEASQIANRCDIKGDKYATGKRVEEVLKSGWYAHGKSRYEAGTNNSTVIKIVKDVFCKGLRTLPRYIDEHDCMSDISSVKNGLKSVKSTKSKWKRHKTVIKNRMGSRYTFYDFPGGYGTGVDPFGYTNKKLRAQHGDFCFPVKKVSSDHFFNHVAYNKFPERGYFKVGDGKSTNPSLKSQIEDIQVFLGLKGFYTGAVDGIYGKGTKTAVSNFQRSRGLDVNGCWGKLCAAEAEKIKL